MLSWVDAHRQANIAAAQAHAELSVDVSAVRVDVVGAIGAARIALMWQPMPHLFGAYVNEAGGDPGILVNSGLPRGARRHTVAHELGHARLRHSTSVDDGSTIDTVYRDEVDAIPSSDRRRAWPDQEKAAEAFAAWFLMPRRIVISALAVLGLIRPRSAEDVYRLSLLLGTSYRSTLRHLPNLRLASTTQCNAWARMAPGTIKARLDPAESAPSSRRPEVWQLTPRFDGLILDVEPGDRIVLPAGVSCAGTEPTWMTELRLRSGAAGTVIEIGDVGEPNTIVLHGAGGWSVQVNADRAPQGLDPRAGA